VADTFDIAVIGAGAAGLAAAQRLVSEPLTVALLEARERVGGRAHTVQVTTASGVLPLDAGCEWLHSADRNPLVPIIEAHGFTVERSTAYWQRRSDRVGISPADAEAFGRAWTTLDARLEAAAASGVDAPASDFLEPGGRWNGLLNAGSGWYNGAAWDEVSVVDYAAYQDSGRNWRVREGYGAAIAMLGGPLAPRLGCAVEEVDHSGATIRIVTAKGTLSARAVIVTAPSNVLASEAIRFRPGLPDKVEAAAGVPLGYADKAWLAVSEPKRFPAEGHCFGRTDTAATAAYFLRPYGRPCVEAYFGGGLAKDLEGQGALAAFAIDELIRVLGADVRRILSPLFETAWASDPWSLGAYSHALPGRAGDRAVLAAPVDGRIFFAGEATHPTYFSTAHGAWETGIRAAEEAIAALAR
jgi:monoamine oxidase